MMTHVFGENGRITVVDIVRNHGTLCDNRMHCMQQGVSFVDTGTVPKPDTVLTLGRGVEEGKGRGARTGEITQGAGGRQARRPLNEIY